MSSLSPLVTTTTTTMLMMVLMVVTAFGNTKMSIQKTLRRREFVLFSHTLPSVLSCCDARLCWRGSCKTALPVHVQAQPPDGSSHAPLWL
eukprot:1097169-Pleurochrysis_carterae.AAC.4